MNLKKNILEIEKLVKNPKKGLPDDLFYFVGRLTPFINVDLLIKCKNHGTLLTWRDDLYSGTGWHVPGGIIRFKENIQSRIYKVAKNEINIKIKSYNGPLEINQIIINQKERSHFISLLYKCEIGDKELYNLLKLSKKNKKIRFFKKEPKKLLKWHKIYKKYI